MPIAISVETKSQDGHGDKARVQLATWVAAHFNRLEKLLENAGRRDVELPVLPLLVAEGAQWTFIPATRNPNGENVCPKLHIVVL